MSRSYSIIGQTPFFAVRVDGFTRYIPAHINPTGKQVNQQLIVNCYANGRARRDGTEGKQQRFRFNMWGKLADSCARALHKGMALDLLATVQAYKGRVWTTDSNGNRVAQVDAAGQPRLEWKVGFTVDQILMAEESQEFIDMEIQSGLRPQFWNVKNHQHYEAYGKILKDKAAMPLQFNPQNPKFGHAEVYLPPGCTLDFSVYNGGMQQQVHHAVNNGMAQYAQQGQQYGQQYGQQPQMQQGMVNPNQGMMHPNMQQQGMVNPNQGMQMQQQVPTPPVYQNGGMAGNQNGGIPGNI